MPASLAHVGLAAITVELDLNEIVNALVYAALGVVVFTLAFWVMAKAVPFSMRKEIEEDQNTALGVIVGSVILGLAIVIGAAIHGGTTVVTEAPPNAAAGAANSSASASAPAPTAAPNAR
ncbi:MAG: DUF350 domain-containing protein [Planctomycetota bacterium]|nr:MAG: DUF350 domain-containing protein [Planctomycetota bacterium]